MPVIYIMYNLSLCFSDYFSIIITYGMDRERKKSSKDNNIQKKDIKSKDFPIYSRVNKLSKRLVPQTNETIKDKQKTPTDPDLTYIQPFFSVCSKQTGKEKLISDCDSEKPGQSLLHSNSQPQFRFIGESDDCTVPTSHSQPQFSESPSSQIILQQEDAPPPLPVRNSSIVSSQIYQKVSNNWKFDYLKQKAQEVEWADNNSSYENAKQISEFHLVKTKELESSTKKETTENEVTVDATSHNETLPIPPKRHSSIASKPISLYTDFKDSDKYFVKTIPVSDQQESVSDRTQSAAASASFVSPSQATNDTKFRSDILDGKIQKEDKQELSVSNDILNLQSSIENISLHNNSFDNSSVTDNDCAASLIDSYDIDLHISQDADIYDISVLPKISFCELVNSVSSCSTQQDTDAEGSITSDSADEHIPDHLDLTDDIFHSQSILGYSNTDLSVRPKIRPKNSSYFEKPNFLDVCCSYINEPIRVTNLQEIPLDETHNRNVLSALANKSDNSFIFDECLQIGSNNKTDSITTVDTTDRVLSSITSTVDNTFICIGNNTAEQTTKVIQRSTSSISKDTLPSKLVTESSTTEGSSSNNVSTTATTFKSNSGSLNYLRKKLLCKVCKSFLPSISGTCKQCCSSQLGESVSPEEVYCGLRLTRQVGGNWGLERLVGTEAY